MYKSIMVSNHERTAAVIRSAMMKHGLEGSPDNYTLSQQLPDKGKTLFSNEFKRCKEIINISDLYNNSFQFNFRTIDSCQGKCVLCN